MKFYFLLLLNLICFSYCKQVNIAEKSYPEIIDFKQTTPRYINGTNDELLLEIKQRIESHIKKPITGKMFLQITIGVDGKVDCARIHRSFSKEIDDFLLDIAFEYEFTLGEYANKKVTTYMTFPLYFNVEK